MARTRTLTNLIADVRQRTGMENSTFCTDAEITEYLNQSIAEFQDLVLDHEGHEFFMTSASSTTVAGTQTYALNAAFYEMHKVVINLGGPQLYTIYPYDVDEHGEATSASSWGWYGGGALPRYRVVGSTLYFSPIPSGAFAFTYYYTPAATRLATGSDTYDGVNGWEEWIILDTAVKCLAKEESDVGFLVSQREKIEMRIQRHASRRDKNQPPFIRDVLRRRSLWRIDG